jgi:hypothetical protein
MTLALSWNESLLQTCGDSRCPAASNGKRASATTLADPRRTVTTTVLNEPVGNLGTSL